MRICSLLPSATEILYALDLGDSVAGVTFECDYPPQARQKPIVVDSVLKHDLTAAEIDRQVSAAAAAGESIYRIDDELLQSLGADVIVTQELCDVCAVSTSNLARTLHALTPQPEVVTLTPHTLEEVFGDIERVGRATGREQKAMELSRSLRERVERIRQLPKRQTPRVACLEWLDPPYNAGHWVPEMVTIAGGVDRMAAPGEYSVRVGWEQLRAMQPEVIVAMPCGYNARKAADEYQQTNFPAWWRELPAVQNGRCYSVHANAYFSRPGPRLVEGIEVLYSLLQQDFSQPVPAEAWLQL